MNEHNLENAEKNRQGLSTVNAKEVQDLPFEFLSKRNNKTTNLVANSGAVKSLKGANRWYDYEFNQPIFLFKIIIDTKGYGSSVFRVKWQGLNGKIFEKQIQNSNDQYNLTVNEFVKKISFLPPKRWMTDTKINSVRLLGFGKDDLESFSNIVSSLETYKNSILSECDTALSNAKKSNDNVASLKSERDTINSDIEALNSTRNELETELKSDNEKKAELKKDISLKEGTLKELKERENSIEEKIEERTSIRNTLSKEIAERKSELQELVDDINLFPSEISGFVKQGGQDVKTYIWISLVPIFILSIVTLLLMFNAAELTTVYSEKSNARIFSIMLTRLPYVLFASAIIGVCYKVIKFCLKEIVKINQQRLNLSKINIIATDVVSSSLHGLQGLDNTEVYNLRTKMKMDMLRDHLKTYLSKDFVPTDVSLENSDNKQSTPDEPNENESDAVKVED